MHRFDLIKWMVSLEGDNLIVFYYFSASMVGDCLKPHNFSGISWREQVPFQGDDGDVHFVLEQQHWWDCYLSSSMK